jgi:hypothetical protein
MPMPSLPAQTIQRVAALKAFSEDAAIGIAGVVAGLMYLLAQMLFSWSLGLDGPLASLQRIAAVLLGPDAAPPSHVASIELGMGVLIHLFVSLVYGFIVGRSVRACSVYTAPVVGAGVGLALFVVGFFGVAPSAFPWFLDVRNLPTAFDHAMFGAVAAWLTIVLQRPEVLRPRA